MIKSFCKHIKYPISLLSIFLSALLISFNIGNSQNNKIDKSNPLVISINSKNENNKINQQQTEKKYIFKNNILNNKENNDATPKNNSQSTKIDDEKEKNQLEINKHNIANKNNTIKKYKFDKKIAENIDKNNNKNAVKSIKNDILQAKVINEETKNTITAEKAAERIDNNNQNNSPENQISNNNIIKKYKFDKKIAENIDKNNDKNAVKSIKNDVLQADLQAKITNKKTEDTVILEKAAEKIDDIKQNKAPKDKVIEDKQINNNKSLNQQNSNIIADSFSKKNDNIFRNQNILSTESKNNYEDFEILNKEENQDESKNTLNLQENGNNIRQFMPLKPTPPRFFAADLSIPEKFANSNNLAKKSGSFYRAFGEIIYLQGIITDSFGVPINNAAIEIWQANSSGKYHSLLEADSEFIDKNFEMSGKTISNNLGNYQFITIMPGTSTNRAPHINMNIYHPQFGKLETEIYFANHPSNKDDYQYLSYNDGEKKLLTCKVEYSEINNPESIKLCIFNVVLKGIHQYKKF